MRCGDAFDAVEDEVINPSAVSDRPKAALWLFEALAHLTQPDHVDATSRVVRDGGVQVGDRPSLTTTPTAREVEILCSPRGRRIAV